MSGIYEPEFYDYVMPKSFHGDAEWYRLNERVLEWTALDLDHRVYLDRSVERLDQDEYELNVQRMGYAKDLIEQIEAACREIETGLASRKFPFDYAQQVELYRLIKSGLTPV